MLVTQYLIGPLVAAVVASPRSTAAVAALAIALGAIGLVADGDVTGQDLIRFTTLVSGSAVAIWIAALRARLQRANAELGETLALLDVVFARAPVGDRAARSRSALLRVNDRLAEINGIAAARHAAGRSASCCPTCRPRSQEDVARVASTGDAAERGRGQRGRRARAGSASYWPVRRAGDGRRSASASS